jgi:hypothetical protein
VKHHLPQNTISVTCPHNQGRSDEGLTEPFVVAGRNKRIAVERVKGFLDNVEVTLVT